MDIREKIQDSLDDSGDDYTLKTNEELIDIISEFGCGETEFHTADIERLIKENEHLKKMLDAPKTKLVKHTVCANCEAVGIIYKDCICTYDKNYPRIELEFETSVEFDTLLEDGNPADTEFNKEQWKKFKY